MRRINILPKKQCILHERKDVMLGFPQAFTFAEITAAIKASLHRKTIAHDPDVAKPCKLIPLRRSLSTHSQTASPISYIITAT
jgi:hypothetical protein